MSPPRNGLPHQAAGLANIRATVISAAGSYFEIRAEIPADRASSVCKIMQSLGTQHLVARDGIAEGCTKKHIGGEVSASGYP